MENKKGKGKKSKNQAAQALDLEKYDNYRS
jgi:hypothetical protein